MEVSLMKLKEAIEVNKSFCEKGDYEVYIMKEDIDNEDDLVKGGFLSKTDYSRQKYLAKITIDEDKGITKEVIDNCEFISLIRDSIGKAIIIEPSWIEDNTNHSYICNFGTPLSEIMEFVMNHSVVIQIEELPIACSDNLKGLLSLPKFILSIHSDNFKHSILDRMYAKVLSIKKCSEDNIEYYRILVVG
jgi:hypothetical protein